MNLLGEFRTREGSVGTAERVNDISEGRLSGRAGKKAIALRSLTPPESGRHG